MENYLNALGFQSASSTLTSTSIELVVDNALLPTKDLLDRTAGECTSTTSSYVDSTSSQRSSRSQLEEDSDSTSQHGESGRSFPPSVPGDKFSWESFRKELPHHHAAASVLSKTEGNKSTRWEAMKRGSGLSSGSPQIPHRYSLTLPTREDSRSPSGRVRRASTTDIIRAENPTGNSRSSVEDDIASCLRLIADEMGNCEFDDESDEDIMGVIETKLTTPRCRIKSALPSNPTSPDGVHTTPGCVVGTEGPIRTIVPRSA